MDAPKPTNIAIEPFVNALGEKAAKIYKSLTNHKDLASKLILSIGLMYNNGALVEVASHRIPTEQKEDDRYQEKHMRIGHIDTGAEYSHTISPIEQRISGDSVLIPQKAIVPLETRLDGGPVLNDRLLSNVNCPEVANYLRATREKVLELLDYIEQNGAVVSIIPIVEKRQAESWDLEDPIDYFRRFTHSLDQLYGFKEHDLQKITLRAEA